MVIAVIGVLTAIGATAALPGVSTANILQDWVGKRVVQKYNNFPLKTIDNQVVAKH